MIKKGLMISILYLVFLTGTIPAFSLTNDETQQLFSAGRSLGSAYYYLLDLTNKSKNTEYLKIKNDYQNAFNSLNITDLIVDDLQINDDSSKLLNDVRFSLYNSLKKQDLSTEKLTSTISDFAGYYDQLHKIVCDKYSNQGTWLLDLGFYSAFQYESINSKDQTKILISGFNKLSSNIPFELPAKINSDIKSINMLDKDDLTTQDLVQLKTNITELLEFFSNYPYVKPLIREVQELVGVWQGILFNPYNQKSHIKLTVNKDLSAVMDINGIAKSITISDIEVVDNYFSFMFKPFGTEKLYIKFSAKLTNNVFAGEITDVLCEKGYWVLAKLNSENTLSDTSMDAMTSYIKAKELKLKEIPVNKAEPLILKEKLLENKQ